MLDFMDKIINRIEEYNPDGDVELVRKACEFAYTAHKGQMRLSGEPYIIHPAEVAYILADLELDIVTIISGLLHDVIEDTSYTFEDLETNFGLEVAELVDGVTKLGRIEYRTKEEQQAENLRKMLIAMAKDIRVILIKLCDRLHNMRTIKYMSENKIREKAQECLEIYAPIAHRLGISKIKWELEDLSLRYLEPKQYYDLVEKVAKKRKEREEYIKEVIQTLEEKTQELGIKGSVDGRPKNFYSIYKKMVNQHKSFEEIFDLTAVRIIVDTIKDCYGVLGVVHTLWKPLPGRFKDYIAMPKPNMYQSIHTTVIGPKGETFEIQIRTWEMHKIAEFGIAAHFKYKENKNTEDNFDQKLTWLRQLLEWQRDTRDAREFMEGLKIDLFTDEVYVFTPKGDVIDLPAGSIPLDFAYKVHSAIGNKCVGAKVNGRMVPLTYQLKNGEIVEILTSSSSHGPSRDWLKLVKSSEAKNKIRQWFKKERREENIIKGREMIEREVRRMGYTMTQLFKNEWLEPLLKKYTLQNIEDLYSAVGYGGITTGQILLRLRDEFVKANKGKNEEKPLQEKNPKEKQVKPKNSKSHGITVKGTQNILVRISKCCNPVPGDEIVGYITRGRGVSVHRADCPNIKHHVDSMDRLIDVEWNTSSSGSYITEIQILASDRRGLLSEITNILSETKIIVTAVNAKTTKEHIAIINLTLEIEGRDQLSKIISKISNLSGVQDVFRITS